MDPSVFFYAPRGDDGIEWIGSVLIWLLLALSAANVVLIVLAFGANHGRTLVTDEEAEALRSLVASGRARDAEARARAGSSDLAFVLARALDHADDGREAMERAAEQAADERLAQRTRAL